MTPEEIQALAQRIASLLDPAPTAQQPPEPPQQSAIQLPEGLPPWAGSAQSLESATPSRAHQSGHRAPYHEIAAAARAAASGRGPSPLFGGSKNRNGGGVESSGEVSVAVSNRHIHLCQQHVEKLFGAGNLTPDRSIRQPGQFAAQQKVRVVGPTGAIDNVRVVGPARGHTQVELSYGDARGIGLHPPLRSSGTVAGSAPVRLEGPAGAVDLHAGAIIAARHLHVSPSDVARLRVKDGDRISVMVGSGDRRATLHDVLVRAGADHATELHIDTDEAKAFGVDRQSKARLLRSPREDTRVMRHHDRRVVTERGVDEIAAAGRTLSRGAGWVLTPSAIDRAKTLGI